MAMRRQVAELTCDANGYAEEDVDAFPHSSVARLTRLYAVKFESTDGNSNPALTIRQLDEDEDGDETPGDILLYIESTDDRLYFPRVAYTVDQEGTAITDSYEPAAIGTEKVRVELDGAEDDAATVTLFYETAGDQRF